MHCCNIFRTEIKHWSKVITCISDSKYWVNLLLKDSIIISDVLRQRCNFKTVKIWQQCLEEKSQSCWSSLHRKDLLFNLPSASTSPNPTQPLHSCKQESSFFFLFKLRGPFHNPCGRTTPHNWEQIPNLLHCSYSTAIKRWYRLLLTVFIIRLSRNEKNILTSLMCGWPCIVIQCG